MSDRTRIDVAPAGLSLPAQRLISTIPIGGGVSTDQTEHIVILMFPQGNACITTEAALELALALPDVVAYLQANHPLKPAPEATTDEAASSKPVAPGFH